MQRSSYESRVQADRGCHAECRRCRCPPASRERFSRAAQRLRVFRIEEAQEVPAAVDESVHSVCFPLETGLQSFALESWVQTRGDGEEYGAFVAEALTAAAAADAADGLLRSCSACCCCMCCIIRSSEILGNITGRSAESTSCGPLEAPWMTGMGQPQYRCLEMSQSLRA